MAAGRKGEGWTGGHGLARRSLAADTRKQQQAGRRGGETSVLGMRTAVVCVAVWLTRVSVASLVAGGLICSTSRSRSSTASVALTTSCTEESEEGAAEAAAAAGVVLVPVRKGWEKRSGSVAREDGSRCRHRWMASVTEGSWSGGGRGGKGME